MPEKRLIIFSLIKLPKFFKLSTGWVTVSTMIFSSAANPLCTSSTTLPMAEMAPFSCAVPFLDFVR